MKTAPKPRTRKAAPTASKLTAPPSVVLSNSGVVAPVPSIGRIVHYIDPNGARHLPGIITAVESGGVGEVISAVSLTVFGPECVSVHPTVPHDPAGAQVGSWHWPEQV